MWPITMAALLLLVTACGALTPLLRGVGWWWTMTLVSSLVLGAAALLARAGLNRWLVPPVLVGVLLGALTLLFGAGTGLLWIIPTPQTGATFESLVAGGTESIVQQSVPAEVTPGILFLLAAGAGVIAILMQVLAVTLRSPALAGIPVLVPLLVPGLIQSTGTLAPALVLTAIAYLLLLRVDVRRRRARDAVDTAGTAAEPPTARVFVSQDRRRSVTGWGTVSVGAVTVVSALVLSVAAPALIGDSGSRPGTNALLFGSGVSPMINLGQDLRRPDAGPVLHYTTTAERRSYFTLLTLDSFVGKTWTASVDGLARSNNVDSISPPPGLGRDVSATPAETSVVIDGVNTRWLPLPARTVSVAGLTGRWHWDSRTRAVAAANASTVGQEYTATALEVMPSAEQMRVSGQDYPASVSGNLELPAEMPADIERIAREVTTGVATGYDAAVALQRYFTSGEFVYDTDAPVAEGYDGGGIDVVGVFLENKRGYCVHFASAMAVMARTLGIPSRIALGYLPGVKSQDLEKGLGQYNVDSHDLHSWPELYFVGVGWVPFEPTPGRGTVPDYEPATAATAPVGGTAAPAPTQAPRAPLDPLAADNVPQDSAVAPTPDGGSTLGWLVAVAMVVALLLLVPAAVRALQYRGRLRRLSTGSITRRTASVLAWREVTDTGRDHGVFMSEADTPRELATRLAHLVGVRSSAATALDRLLVGLERARFDRPDESDLTVSDAPMGAAFGADVAEVVRAVRGQGNRRVRWRARLMPASLAVSLWRRLNGFSPRNA